MDDTTYTTPDWFWEAIEDKPESGFVEVLESDINYLYWSTPGNPGLMLVHGHNAHAHWWDFIAPSYKNEYQTVALDLSGMGDSDHRDEYSAETYAKEIVNLKPARFTTSRSMTRFARNRFQIACLLLSTMASGAARVSSHVAGVEALGNFLRLTFFKQRPGLHSMR